MSTHFTLAAEADETVPFVGPGHTFSVYVSGSPSWGQLEVHRLNSASGVFDVVGHIVVGKTPQYIQEDVAGTYKLVARGLGSPVDFKIEVNN